MMKPGHSASLETVINKRSDGSLLLTVIAMTVVMAAASLFTGCQNGPLSPTAQVMIKSMSPNPLAPNTISDTAEITFPLCEIALESRNQIPSYVTGYSIRYIRRDGVDMGEHFKRSGSLTHYLKADEELTIKLEVFTTDLYESLGSNIMPAEARIDVFGKDENDNPWSVRGFLPITITDKF